MKNSSLKDLAQRTSGAIYWEQTPADNYRLQRNIEEIILNSLQLVEKQNWENRVEMGNILSTLLRSPNICPVMSGAKLNQDQIFNYLKRLEELSNFDLSPVETTNKKSWEK